MVHFELLRSGRALTHRLHWQLPGGAPRTFDRAMDSSIADAAQRPEGAYLWPDCSAANSTAWATTHTLPQIDVEEQDRLRAIHTTLRYKLSSPLLPNTGEDKGAACYTPLRSAFRNGQGHLVNAIEIVKVQVGELELLLSELNDKSGNVSFLLHKKLTLNGNTVACTCTRSVGMQCIDSKAHQG